jgi:hypothetical protein
MEQTFCSINDLLQAATKIAAYPPDADPDVEMRAKLAVELATLISFVDDHPPLAPLFPKTRELQKALFEVQRGRHVSWLEPKKAGRPPVALENQHLRGHYAAVAHFLMDHGERTETDAVNLVAGHGKVARLMPKSQAPNRELVRDWRQAALANGGRDHPELRAGFDHQLAWMKFQWWSDPGKPVAKAKQWLKVIDSCSEKS